MHEGRKHQIRDIGGLLGLPVVRLVRVRMGGRALGELPTGQWRELRPEEIKQLREPGAPAARAPRRRGARLGSRRNHSPLRGPSLGRRQWTSGPV